MASVRPRACPTAGFSLVETLVALALAAILAGMLTRFVSGSRLNAWKIREHIAIDVLSDDLIERVAPYQWQVGRTDGRSGTLAWRIDVTPIAFVAHARSVKPKKKNTDADGNPTSAPGLTASSESTGDEKNDDEPKFGAKATPPTTVPANNWVPYRVTALVRAPSGRSRLVYTLRIGPQQTEKQSDTDQR